MGLAPQNPSPPLRGAPDAPLRGGGARRARPRYTHVKDALVDPLCDKDVCITLGCAIAVGGEDQVLTIA